MNDLIKYAIESSVSLAVLWIFYELALGRDTRHRSNRYFLLGSMLFSLVIPLINIRINGAGNFIPSGGLISVLLPEVIIRPAYGTMKEISIAGLASLAYAGGLALSVLSVIAGMFYPVKLITTSGRRGRIITFLSENRACFSTLGHIFISSSVSGPDAGRMINHEMKHIRMGHHSDLILVTLVTALQWFNPAAYFLRRRLFALHEFEADNACISDGEDPVLYTELLLSSVFRSRNSVLANNFSSSSLLKNRIIMMTKKRTGRGTSLKMIMAIPVAFMLMFMFACNGGNKTQKETPSEGVPAAVQAETQSATAEGATADTPSDVFTKVEKMPVFMSDTTGMSLRTWLMKNIKYPKEAAEKGIQGKVMVEFVVDEQGNLTNAKVVKGVDPVLDQAALDVMAGCPKWEPGMQDGVPVKVSMTIPIVYALK